jgi:NADH-quinone oxidoreductase subunit J
MIGFNFLFICLAAITILGALMVISSRNPVKAVLSLVLTFVGASGLWLTMQAEFLALVLVVVYVGAVMVLFMFVVMMLNIEEEKTRKKYMSYWVIAFLAALILFGLLYYVIGLQAFDLKHVPMAKMHSQGYSNVTVLADRLFKDFVYPFEVVGAILLVAMISAITLAYRGPSKSAKRQKISAQIAVDPKKRVKLVNLKSEK